MSLFIVSDFLMMRRGDVVRLSREEGGCIIFFYEMDLKHLF